MVIVGYATEGRDRMALGIVSDDSKYFYWCIDGTLEIDPNFEKQQLKNYYATFMSDNISFSENFISKKIIKKVLLNSKCRHFSLDHIIEDLEPWICFDVHTILKIPKLDKPRKICVSCFNFYNFELLNNCSSECLKSVICDDCLAQWLKTQVPSKKAIQCLDKNCNGEFNAFDLPNLSESWTKALFLQLNPGYIKCPCCESLLFVDKGQMEGECPNCKQNFCLKCLKPFHKDQFCEVIDLKQELANVPNLIICPTCKFVGIYDDKSCNKVMCTNCYKTMICVCCKMDISIQDYHHFCRSFIDSEPCQETKCKHCHIWPNIETAKRADPDFLKKFPKFEIPPEKKTGHRLLFDRLKLTNDGIDYKQLCCPSCKFPIEKRDGYNMQKCCEYLFCLKCNMNVPNGHFCRLYMIGKNCQFTDCKHCSIFL